MGTIITQDYIWKRFRQFRFYIIFIFVFFFSKM